MLPVPRHNGVNTAAIATAHQNFTTNTPVHTIDNDIVTRVGATTVTATLASDTHPVIAQQAVNSIVNAHLTKALVENELPLHSQLSKSDLISDQFVNVLEDLNILNQKDLPESADDVKCTMILSALKNFYVKNRLKLFGTDVHSHITKGVGVVTRFLELILKTRTNEEATDNTDIIRNLCLLETSSGFFLFETIKALASKEATKRIICNTKGEYLNLTRRQKDQMKVFVEAEKISNSRSRRTYITFERNFLDLQLYGVIFDQWDLRKILHAHESCGIVYNLDEYVHIYDPYDVYFISFDARDKFIRSSLCSYSDITTSLLESPSLTLIELLCKKELISEKDAKNAATGNKEDYCAVIEMGLTKLYCSHEEIYFSSEIYSFIKEWKKAALCMRLIDVEPALATIKHSDWWCLATAESCRFFNLVDDLLEYALEHNLIVCNKSGVFKVWEDLFKTNGDIVDCSNKSLETSTYITIDHIFKGHRVYSLIFNDTENSHWKPFVSGEKRKNYIEQELEEFSAASVPSSMEALIQAMLIEDPKR